MKTLKKASKSAHKPKAEKSECNNSIKRAVESGQSMRDVGEKFDISAKRVFDIAHRAKVKVKAKAKK